MCYLFIVLTFRSIKLLKSQRKKNIFMCNAYVFYMYYIQASWDFNSFSFFSMVCLKKKRKRKKKRKAVSLEVKNETRSMDLIGCKKYKTKKY